MPGPLRKLFTSLQIGEVEIKNRIAMAPMGILGLLNPDGSPGPRAIHYYMERAKGGVGLIITGIFKVENQIEPLDGIVPLVSRTALGPFTELSEAVHALGAKIFVQLTIGLGRVCNPLRLPVPPVSASAIPSYWKPEITCRELRTEEVEHLVKRFGPAAEILAEAGIDGVELHGHEGYLFDQFATSAWNRRTDKYGGSLENRLRLPIEVLREIKKGAGQKFPVQYRFGLKHYMKALNSGALPGEKFVEAGRDIPEGLQMAKLLEEAGFDALHVDAGCYDSWYWPHTVIYQEPGCMVDMAARAKGVVRIPVIGVGKLDDPELAERVIAEGRADMVALGKALLADAHWVRKAAEGRIGHIRPCIGCNDGCIGRVIKGKPLSCAVNPATGRERTHGLERTDTPQRVLIVGGGASGMEAARVAALRGHHVTLYDRAKELGGHLIEASVPPFKKDVAHLLDWFKRELSAIEMDVQLGVEVTPDTITKEKPGVVIIAAGSKPFIPEIPGIGRDNVATAADLLLGKKKVKDSAVVVGGGLIGCETALWLAQQGKKVTLVEMLEDLMIAGIPVTHMNRLMLLDLLKYYGVKVITRSSLLEVSGDGVVLVDQTFQRTVLPSETVILAVGLVSDQELYKKLRGEVVQLFLVGDGRKAQNIMNAVWDAYEVARTI